MCEQMSETLSKIDTLITAIQALTVAVEASSVKATVELLPMEAAIGFTEPKAPNVVNITVS